MKKEKSLKLNYIFSIIKSVMAFVFPMLSFPYATRVLGVNNLGIVSYVTSFLSYFSLFASLGIVIYATREGAKIKDDRRKLTQFSKEIFCFNCMSTVIVYCVFLLVLFFLTKEKYFVIMLICSLSMWFTLIGVEWIYQIEEDFTYISIRSMFFQFISLILLYTLVKTEDDYVIYAAIQVLAAGGSSILNLINSRKYIDWNSKCKLDLKRHVKPVFVVFGISAASSIYINLDTVMLKWIKTEYEVGLYAAAVKMNTMIKSVINSLSVVLLSRLSNYVSKKADKEYKNLLYNAFSINLGIAIPSAVGMFMIARYILLIFSGMNYLDAVTSSRILAINLVFAVIDGMIYYQILLPFNMDKFACIGTVIGAFANVVLNLILIPYASINGAAVATVLSELLVMCSFCFFLKKKLQISKLFHEVPKIIICCIPIIIICYLVQLCKFSVIIGALLCVLGSVATYSILCIAMKTTIANEVLSIICKKREI